MSDLDKRKQELDPELAERLIKLVAQDGTDMLGRVSELDTRLTNTNFLTNGGGAVAVLAFMGQQHSAPACVKAALLLFTLGVIATGIEVRALLIHFGAIGSDHSRRLRAFNSGSITVKELGTISPGVGRISKHVNHYAGLISQIFFAAGVLIGAFGFLSAST